MPKAPQAEFLTIAAIRKSRGRREIEYLFNEKQQIFTFRSKSKTAAAAAERLEEAFEKEWPVKARLDMRKGFIQRISRSTAKEVAQFERKRTVLADAARPRRIEVAKIDPTTFNIVDHYLKHPVFRLCRHVVPSYQSAKTIFDFCAKQSCHLPGPYDISPCIPFQYVPDGCYARAHKMRWIITTRYRYCCDKVFSFANQDNDRLAVQANKWGGCCITWWYHVAPLIRVRIRLSKLRNLSIVLAMVIDPSMFDKPVLLSTWLSAQENTACHPNAHVSMYSIQPGSAYWPASYDGTTFGTDPTYTLTDGTLTSYRNLVSCP